MGFSRIDSHLTFDGQIAGAVIHCDGGVEVVLNGKMMFAGTFGFSGSKSWYFLCAVNGRDGYVLERENCDCGEGWYLYDWWERRPQHYTQFDDAVHAAMCASEPALENRYLHRIAGMQPWRIQAADNEHCRAMRDVIEKKAVDANRAWIL